MSWMTYYVEVSMQQREEEIQRRIRGARPAFAPTPTQSRRRRPWRRPAPVRLPLRRVSPR